MKRFYFSFIVCLLALACSVSSVSAVTKTKAKPTPPVLHTVIGSISASSITVDTGSSSKTYKIDRTTTFTFQGNTVNPSVLKAGMRVSVTAGGFDGLTAAAVDASEAPTAAPAAAGGKKK